MLVKCDQVSRIGFSRLQGCFVDNGEIKKVCDFIKEQQEVVYDPNFLDLEDHSNDLEVPTLSAPSAAEMRAASNEDKYQMIKQVIMTREYTSISQIQREFSVGFPRAGKIFQRLQQEGVVANAPDSPSSSKGCRVLIHGTDPLD
jgi:S-DNA-T family DNA segregation ATPase FtsK/SpoIIIE